MFDAMYDCVRLNNVACSNACRPVAVHAVLMSAPSSVNPSQSSSTPFGVAASVPGGIVLRITLPGAQTAPALEEQQTYSVPPELHFT